MAKKKVKEKKKNGRPSGYTQKIADKICERIALGESIRSVSECETMPCAATMFKWMRDYPEFLKQYEKATTERAHYQAEEIIDIADNSTNDFMTKHVHGEDIEVVNHENIQRSRLRVDTRKWLMSKMVPKKYGERISQEITGKDDQKDSAAADKPSVDGISEKGPPFCHTE